jgi:uncharacterized surface protein with fasciclin (FAS1) repeats
LPTGTVDNLLKPENKPPLVKILTCPVVAGRLSAADIAKQIKADKGKAELTTVSGGTLRAMMDGKNIALKDEKGGMSKITQSDLFQSNGMTHVVDSALLPS